MGDPRPDEPITGEAIERWEQAYREKRRREIWPDPLAPDVVVMRVPRLKEHRLRMRMTQKQLAAKSGVSVSTISRIESGLTLELRMETWDALANALEVSALELVEIVRRPISPEERREQALRVMQRREKEAARQRERREREREKRRRAGAANDTDPQSEAPERPLPGDRTDEG